MEPSKLVEIGLTNREADTYLVLLRLEEATAGTIAQKTKEARTNVYDTLNSLIKRGLVSYVIRNSRRYYRAAPPAKLFDFLKEKEESLNKIMPELLKISKSEKSKPIVEVYEGKEGIKTVLNDLIRTGKNFVGFGATDRAFILFPEFTKMYMREREKIKIRARQIYTEGERVLRTPLSKFKFIPREYSSPATTLVYGSKVAIFMWFIEPPIVVLIENEEAAEAYKNHFEFMWKVLAKRKRKQTSKGFKN